MKQATQAVHTGVYVDTAYNSVTTPIYPSSTFYFDRLGHHRGYDYGRSGNPTRSALAENLAALENGRFADITATGMAAITSVMFLLNPGDHAIVGQDVYGGTYRLFHSVLAPMGYRFSFVDMRDLGNVEAAVRKETRCIWIETPSNPLLTLVDVPATTGLARRHGLLSVVDNTFASPYFQQPLELGADVVVHSTTKYINGHSDVVGGAIITKDERLAERIAFIVNAIGTPCSPFDAFLVLRGVKTLPLRMEAHQRNAMAVARFLTEHPSVKRVYYPGLEDHPQHALARRQMSGFGGMLSFDLDLERVGLEAFFSKLAIFRLAESLGGVESLIEQPWTMSHAGMSEEARRQAGISAATIRVAAGVEDPDDLVADLGQAMT
jgi:cystathionine gamma-synthase